MFTRSILSDSDRVLYPVQTFGFSLLFLYRTLDSEHLEKSGVGVDLRSPMAIPMDSDRSVNSYLPLIRCDSCGTARRHAKVSEEPVPEQDFDSETEITQTGRLLLAEIWACQNCGAKRRYGGGAQLMSKLKSKKTVFTAPPEVAARSAPTLSSWRLRCSLSRNYGQAEKGTRTRQEKDRKGRENHPTFKSRS